MALFLGERADDCQPEAPQIIFGGHAGQDFAELIGEVRGVEFARIEFEVADDLA